MFRTIFASMLIATTLAACNGGGSSDGGTPPPVQRLSLLAGSIGSDGNLDGIDARFNSPKGVAVDADGTVFVADTDNHTIRRIAPDGLVTTVAGRPGVEGSDDGMGSAARFRQPSDVAVDGVGNLYVADAGNSCIRKITPAGEVSTLAGSAQGAGSEDGPGASARFYYPRGLAVDRHGFVYVADSGNYTIRRIAPDGTVSTLAGRPGTSGYGDGDPSTARFASPSGVAVDSDGFVYVADTLNKVIRRIDPTGKVTTLAGMATQSGYVGSIVDGVGASARFYLPHDVTVAANGDLYVTDSGAFSTDWGYPTFGGNSVIRKIDRAGVVTTIAGVPGTLGSADGTGGHASFFLPSGIAASPDGSIYVADTYNHTIRKIGPDGLVNTYAGQARRFGNTDGSLAEARFLLPSGVAADRNGNLYLTDSYSHAIRKIDSSGTVATLAGAVWSHGDSDGEGQSARFMNPKDVTADGDGNVLVADGNGRIRKITPAGNVTTLPLSSPNCGDVWSNPMDGTFRGISGIAVGPDGSIFVSDTGYHAICKVSPSGKVSKLAGGVIGFPGYADGKGPIAEFNNPGDIAVDAKGNAYVADTGNNVIRKITPDGTVSTLAGSAGNAGHVDGLKDAARFDSPMSIAVDSKGILYVADINNHAIRRITPAGAVSTYAGTPGSWGIRPGNLPGSLSRPRGVAVSKHGLVITTESAVMILGPD